MLCATIEDPTAAQPEDRALCFATFYAAIATLEPPEAQVFITDAAASQLRFKTGFEQALAEAEVLENPTLALLSALAVFLVSSLPSLFNR